MLNPPTPTGTLFYEPLQRYLMMLIEDFIKIWIVKLVLTTKLM